MPQSKCDSCPRCSHQQRGICSRPQPLLCWQGPSPAWPGEGSSQGLKPRQEPPPSPQGLPAAAVHLHLDSPQPKAEEPGELQLC